MERDGKMRILVDTNILFSALVFSRSKPARALLYIADNHEIVLCDRNIAGLRDILGRKAPKYLPDAEVLLAEMSYELIPAVDHAEKLIRDAKDQPILNAAIVSDVEVILTGRSEEHTSELQSRFDLVCRLLLEKKKTKPSHQKYRQS